MLKCRVNHVLAIMALVESHHRCHWYTKNGINLYISIVAFIKN